MINFKVSAPGSMILCGEHIMMYEKHVVAAGLNLRTTLKFCVLDVSSKMIKIEFPDVNLSLNLSLELVLNFFFGNEHTNSMESYIFLLRQVQYFITSNGMWTTDEQKYSLQTFFFLLIYIAHKEKINIISFHVHLTTQLPMNAGLGSSTSFAVCLAACFVHWKRLQRGHAHKKFNDKEIQRISQYANSCEEVVQNYMPEKYSEVCTYGQIFRYRYNNIRRGYKYKLLIVPRMKILLIDSGIRLKKYQQMEKIANMRYSHVKNVKRKLNNIHTISMTVSGMLAKLYDFIIQRNNFLRNLQEIYSSLSIYIQTNQILLRELGLSHRNLNKICTIAQTNNLSGKLTGFGGYAYILLPPDTSNEYITHITEQLTAEGFTVTETCVSCSGVTIDE